MSKKALINGLIVVVAVSAGIALSIKPWEVYQDQRLAADEAVAEMKVSEAKREGLVRKEAILRSSIGKEQLARDRGWLPSNEVPAPKVP
jgi:hypothetical protein